MTSLGPTTVLATFVIFSRIGACLMLMPGISSPRVPVQVRLFIAIGLSLALTPILIDHLVPIITDDAPVKVLALIISESLVGAMIGLLGRIFYIALETLSTGIATMVGLGNTLGAPIESDQALPEIVSLITMAATVLLFVTDQHWEILRGLVASYTALPVSHGFDPRFGLSQLTDGAGSAFVVSLRISSPFLIFSIIINAAIGLTNKLTPQISVFFISLPFTIAGGLFLFYFTCKQLLDLFVAAFASWLASG